MEKKQQRVKKRKGEERPVKTTKKLRKNLETKSMFGLPKRIAKRERERVLSR